MNTTLRIGDLLYRKKGTVDHVGVYWGSGRVLHNSPSNHTELVSYTDYANGQPVKVIYTESVDIHLLSERLNLILSAKNNSYHPFLNNCEHIATFLIHGRKWSPQVQATVFGCIAGAFIGNKIRDGGWILGLVAGGILGCTTSNFLRKYDMVIEPHRSIGIAKSAHI